MNQLVCGDCMKIMEDIPSGSVDMILCDLPYGQTHSTFDKRLPLNALWAHYTRIIKQNGCIALFAQGKFYTELTASNLKMFRYDLIWDKQLPTGFLNANRMPLRTHEKIAIFYKGLPVYHPQFTEGKPLHSKGKSYREKTIVNRNYGKFHATEDVRAGTTEKYPTSIIRIPKAHPSVAVHPTEKPVALCKWLIETYTDPGDTVLDNCMGAGSTGIACVQSGRGFIGIELCEEYFAIAERRIREAEKMRTQA